MTCPRPTPCTLPGQGCCGVSMPAAAGSDSLAAIGLLVCQLDDMV